jgi:enamine deaminase RidA (YjgF/YER057c/UK114 family)
MTPRVKIVNPESLGAPKGYSNGILASGKMLFIAGQISWDGGDFAAQFSKALANVLEVVRAAGGKPKHLARLTIYVTDKREYVGSLPAVGKAYTKLMGKHFPAMTLLEVKALLEPGAKIEIEATAVLP